MANCLDFLWSIWLPACSYFLALMTYHLVCRLYDLGYGYESKRLTLLPYFKEFSTLPKLFCSILRMLQYSYLRFRMRTSVWDFACCSGWRAIVNLHEFLKLPMAYFLFCLTPFPRFFRLFFEIPNNLFPKWNLLVQSM